MVLYSMIRYFEVVDQQMRELTEDNREISTSQISDYAYGGYVIVCQQTPKGEYD